ARQARPFCAGRAPAGDRSAAQTNAGAGDRMNLCLFDLDHTLLPLDSDHEFGEFLIRQGLADPVEYRRRNDGFYQQYCEGTLVLGDYIRFTTSVWRQLDATAQAALQQAFMDEVIRPAMHPQALE